MAYKSRLQTNNIDLSAILADINNLPPAGTEDISAELNALSDAVDAHLKMVNRKVAENNGEGEYVWKKLTAEGGDFIDFVVSSDANAYPDGGEQDGYYYELISQPVDLAKELDLIPANIRSGIDIFGVLGTMSEGVSGIDFGEITPSSTQTRFTIPHKLNKTPKYAIIICSVWNSDGRIVAIDSANGFCLGTSMSMNQKLTLSSTTISGNPLVAGLQGGVKHYWFAIA